MTRANLKQIFISILIGATVAFFSTLFESLADFMKTHSTEIISGTATSFYHLVKTYRV